MGLARLVSSVIAPLLLALGSPVLIPAAGAATITSVASSVLPGASTGSIGPVGATPAPNNDNTAAASPNVIPVSIFFNTFGTAEIEFDLAASAGTTEYRVTQSLVNNTGVPWIGFRFELGFGTGDGFVSSGAVDLLDFDEPDRDPAATSSIFTTATHEADSLDWSGGIVPSGSVGFTFAIDVPDGLATSHPLSLNRFTLRQAPIPVPEPTTLAILGLGLAGLATSHRGKQ